MRNFIPGPNQERWLVALETGMLDGKPYVQGKGRLFRQGKHCCIGVGAAMFLPAGVMEINWLGDGVFADEALVAPRYLVEALRLYGPSGQARDHGHPSIATLNDGGGYFGIASLSHPEIAALIRSDPAMYFEVPA